MKDDEISSEGLQEILDRVLDPSAVEIAASRIGAISFARIMCQNAIVLDCSLSHDSLKEGSFEGPVHVHVHDLVTGNQERLGLLVRHRRCGAYEARLAHDLQKDIWKIIVSPVHGQRGAPGTGTPGHAPGRRAPRGRDPGQLRRRPGVRIGIQGHDRWLPSEQLRAWGLGTFMPSSNEIARQIGILRWKRLDGDEGARLEAQLDRGATAVDVAMHTRGGAQELPCDPWTLGRGEASCPSGRSRASLVAVALTAHFDLYESGEIGGAFHGQVSSGRSSF